MARKLSEKALDKKVEAAYYATCSGIQINIMDIGKVFKAGRAAIDANPAITDEALGTVVRTYVDAIRVG